MKYVWNDIWTDKSVKRLVENEVTENLLYHVMWLRCQCNIYIDNKSDPFHFFSFKKNHNKQQSGFLATAIVNPWYLLLVSSLWEHRPMAVIKKIKNPPTNDHHKVQSSFVFFLFFLFFDNIISFCYTFFIHNDSTLFLPFPQQRKKIMLF